MSLRLAPNLPSPTLPEDLRARWLMHENGGQHALCEVCSVAVAWTRKEQQSGAWLRALRAHRCGERGA